MRLGERFSLLFKIFLPVLVLLVFKVSPFSSAAQRAQLDARTALNSGDHRSASSALLEVVRYEPWHVELWEQAGREALAAGQLDDAIFAFQRADLNGNLSGEGRFLLGDAYLRQGDDRSAEAAWQASLRVDGPSARVLERLVQVQEKRGDYQAANSTLHAWRKLEPGSPQVAYLLGLNLSIIQPEQALPFLLEAAQNDSAYSPSVQVLRTGLSIATINQNPAYGWLMIGRSLGSLGRWDLADIAFQKALDLAPQYAEAWAFLGEARYQQGKGGKTELDQARALEPDSIVVNALYALYFRRSGASQAALEYLQAIATKEPQEPIWQVEIGNTLVEMGDLPAARAAFQSAVDLAPENTQYWQYLARFSIFYQVDVQNLGLSAARKAVLLAPQDPGALDTIGLAMLYLEDYASAERFLQRALERDATYAPASLHMGQLFLQRKDLARAQPFLKRAISLSGDGEAGKIARRLLSQYYGERD